VSRLGSGLYQQDRRLAISVCLENAVLLIDLLYCLYVSITPSRYSLPQVTSYPGLEYHNHGLFFFPSLCSSWRTGT